MGEAKRKRAAELEALRRLRTRLFLVRLDKSMDTKTPCITVDPSAVFRLRAGSMTDAQRMDMTRRLHTLLIAVPLDDDEQREVVAETGIDTKRLAERLRNRVDELHRQKT